MNLCQASVTFLFLILYLKAWSLVLLVNKRESSSKHRQRNGVIDAVQLSLVCLPEVTKGIRNKRWWWLLLCLCLLEEEHKGAIFDLWQKRHLTQSTWSASEVAQNVSCLRLIVLRRCTPVCYNNPIEKKHIRVLHGLSTFPPSSVQIVKYERVKVGHSVIRPCFVHMWWIQSLQQPHDIDAKPHTHKMLRRSLIKFVGWFSSR